MESSPGKRIHDESLTFISGEVRPLHDRILVRPLPPALSQTIHANWNGEPVRGEVIAVGPGKFPNIHTRFWKDGKEVRQVRQSTVFRPTQVKPGDKIQLGGMELGGYLWIHVNYEGEDCIWCTEQDITFIET